MAVGFVGSAHAKNSSGDLVVTVPAGVTTDMLLVAEVAVVSSSATYSDPAGWNVEGTVGHGLAGNTAIYSSRLYSRRGLVAGDTVSFPVSGTAQKGVQLAAFSGADSLAGVAGLEEPSAGTAAHVCPNVTATAQGLPAAMASDRSSASWTSPAGWTERHESYGGSSGTICQTLATRDTVVASGGSVTGPTLTGSVSSSTAAMWTFVVREAVVDTTAPIITGRSVIADPTGAVVAWTTDEASTSYVEVSTA